ncbi:MAG: prolipoprotein diacylglyceryl transferase [Actinomycetota bacterium]
MVSALEVTYRPIPSFFGVSPHGLLAAAGIAVGFLVLSREVRRRGLPTEVLDAAVLWGVLAGVLGARADYVISHLREFTSPLQVVKVWEGGLALFGGLIAGLAVGVTVAARKGAHVPRLLDAAAAPLALAIAVGRIGDLIIGDHLGTPTTSTFALAFRVESGYHLAPGFGLGPAAPPGPGQSCTDVGSYFAGCAYHLTPAYDLLGALLLAGLIVWLRRRLPLRAGVAFAVFLLWYPLQRLLVDVTRGIDERPLLGLTGTQLLAVVIVTAAVVLLAVVGLRHRGLGEAPGDPPSAVAPLLRDGHPIGSRPAEPADPVDPAPAAPGEAGHQPPQP